MKNGDVKASDALPNLLKNLVHRLIQEVAGKLFRIYADNVRELKEYLEQFINGYFRGSEDGLQDFTRSLTNLLKV